MNNLLTATMFCWAVDINHQAAVLDDPSTDWQHKTAAVKALLPYGLLCYYQTRDQLTPLGEHWCKMDVYPVVLSQRTKALIADLTSKQFAARQRAQTELIEIGKYNRLMLYDALSKSVSIEETKRLNSVLDSLPKLHGD